MQIGGNLISHTIGRLKVISVRIILPEVEEVDVDINESDLKIDTMRSQGAGG